MRIGVLRSLVPAMLAMSVLGTSRASAAPPLDLPDLPLVYLADGPELLAGYQGTDAPGEWTITGGGLDAADRLTLAIEIRLDPLSVPLDPGPAVLFGAVMLDGDAGGDVGVNVHVERVVSQVLPPCDPADCVHRATVTLPTDRLHRLARDVDARGWLDVEVSLSLVRTFAQGTWIQYVGLQDEDREAGENGTAGRPATFTSRLVGGGAAPAERARSGSRRSRETLELVERLVASAPDPSRTPAMVPLLVDITASACTPGYTIVTATGDTVLDRRRLGASGPIRVAVPAGTTWSLAVPSRWWGSSDADLELGPIDVVGATLVSGHVSGDGEDGLCAPEASVSWRPAGGFEVAEPPVTGRCLASTSARCLS